MRSEDKESTPVAEIVDAFDGSTPSTFWKIAMTVLVVCQQTHHNHNIARDWTYFVRRSRTWSETASPVFLEAL